MSSYIKYIIKINFILCLFTFSDVATRKFKVTCFSHYNSIGQLVYSFGERFH